MSMEPTSANLLIVDDEKPTRDGLRAALEDRFEVYVAENATEALDSIQQGDTYDLILMDINLPDIDGYTLTNRLKQMEAFNSVPIIALTANVMKGDRERSLEAGCDGYIQKPIDVDDLPNQIAHYLKR